MIEIVVNTLILRNLNYNGNQKQYAHDEFKNILKFRILFW
jgi:hypothetical protein